MSKLLEKYFFLVKNFFPEKSRRPAIGLDIGSRSCKLVEAVPGDNGCEVLNWAIESYGEGSPVEVIRKLLAKFEADQKNVYTAISGQGTLIRYLTIPRMPLEDFKKSFSLEVDKYFPFPKDSIYTDCFILDPGGKESKMSVLIAAARKEMVDQRIQLLSSLSVPANFIGLTAIALVNTFRALRPRKPSANSIPDVSLEAAAILDMGDLNSGILILRDNLPRFTRSISLGGRELNKRVSNALGIPIEEAEKIKTHPQEQFQNIMNACEPVLMNLISEIRLSLDYFVTENNMTISRLYLTGGSAEFQGMDKFLSDNLEMPVELWNPMGALKLAPSVSPEELQKNIHKLTVALGLSLQNND